MTLKQLRILREIARRSLNISAAAAALHTSQPGVSRQLQLLEQELGVKLLVRRSNRVLALTEVGRAVLAIASRALDQIDGIQQTAREARDELGGRLRVATTHLHARYSLPAPIKAFVRRYPSVELQLLQVDVDDIARLVEGGESEIGVGSAIVPGGPGLVALPGEVIARSLIVPRDHPLARRRRVTLADIARWPVLGYNARSRSGGIIARRFRQAGLEVRYVVSASDSDVIKAYVAQGLGIAVVPSMAVDPKADDALAARDVTALFEATRTTIVLRRAAYPRRYLTDFIGMMVPRWTREAVLAAIEGDPRASEGCG